MGFIQRLRLAWRILCYRGPWMPRYINDEPSIFDYPPDVVPSFPTPGIDRDVELVPIDTPMLRLLPRQQAVAPVCEWRSIAPRFAATAEEEG